MRKLFGIGTPRSPQDRAVAACAAVLAAPPGLRRCIVRCMACARHSNRLPMPPTTAMFRKAAANKTAVLQRVARITIHEASIGTLLPEESQLVERTVETAGADPSGMYTSSVSAVAVSNLGNTVLQRLIRLEINRRPVINGPQERMLVRVGDSVQVPLVVLALVIVAIAGILLRGTGFYTRLP